MSRSRQSNIVHYLIPETIERILSSQDEEEEVNEIGLISILIVDVCLHVCICVLVCVCARALACVFVYVCMSVYVCNRHIICVYRLGVVHSWGPSS